ncbi:MAG: chorismate lyase [Zetaproteobacteria bacterium CG_4_9_14_3_um_filter_49_83]|nr:MAG: hypothetical protein AUJ56_04175 [Zetaproteobacteria bacterium CG1_02_49_23]PIQ30495.1 MAG: hypothetical protein COW62_12410 [Zetaproteobacteria bacterium CG17_big_fil_post_rev_8_21_14_2_50_50_13]PIV29401.1 MAG: chorismate lyase [Zetaproteobacteria bacterium CG02_land_8_20_14_3_00_50_9]PIY55277.1 MAG: chorismate lyase [Zetaproteobacteria bacterium CG_4_10_14_0_8_um_filter_49_80]PJA36089.1 MAG: chorismate lyase [Zetaproteobacteria bacterium CG_4_9_14_3_um_filter_49_83]
MFLTGIDQESWTPVREWQADKVGVPRDMAAILTVTSSLTRFLERHYRMVVKVRLHDQFVDQMEAGEAMLLGAQPYEPAMRRRVSLMHRDSVMFDAESVLPLDTLPADLIDDLEAGKRPLGNLLLDRGLFLSRSDLSIMRISEGHAHAGCWARRSVLRSESGTRALVVEVFRDEIWQRLDLLRSRR